MSGTRLPLLPQVFPNRSIFEEHPVKTQFKFPPAHPTVGKTLKLWLFPGNWVVVMRGGSLLNMTPSLTFCLRADKVSSDYDYLSCELTGDFVPLSLLPFYILKYPIMSVCSFLL